MLAIFHHLDAKIARASPPRLRFAEIETEIGIYQPSHLPSDRWIWEVSAKVTSRVRGNQNEKENAIMIAKRLIAKEVYGELVDDAFEVLRMLHEECPRNLDDPIIKLVNNMIDKMEGKETGDVK